MTCKISVAAGMGILPKYKSTIDTIAKHFSTDPDKVGGFAMKLQDFYETIRSIEGKNALAAMGEHTDIVSTVDEWVTNHSYGKYKSYDSLIKSGDNDIVKLMNAQLNDEIKYVAAVYDNPTKVKIDQKLSTEFRRVFNFNASVMKRGNAATNILSGDAMGLPGELLINRSTLFKQWRPAQRTYAQIEGIQNGTDNYIAKSRKIVRDMIDSHTDDIVTDKILTKYAPYLDGSYQNGKNTIRRLLEEREGMNADDISHTMTSLEAFQKDWNIFNYGKEDPKGMTNKEILDSKYENLIPHGKGKVPTFLNFVLNTGIRLKALTDARTSGLHDMEKKVSKLFGVDGEFKIRSDNYMPSRQDNLFNGIIESPEMERLYGDVSFMKHRKAMIANEDEDIDFLEMFTSNVKTFKHFASKISEYAGFRLIKDKMDDNTEFKKRNPTAYRGINHLAEVVIEDYETIPKKVSAGVQGFKKLFGAFSGLVASTTLMNSAMANYAAGAITIASRLGIRHAGEVIFDYKNKLKETGLDGDVARSVKEYFSNYSPYSKVSDVITKDLSMQEIGMNKIVDGIADKAMQLSDWAMSSGVMGTIKGLKWLAFNESENKLLSIAESAAFEQARIATAAAKDAAEADNKEFNQKEFLNKFLAEQSESIFTLTKEAVGDFSKYAKPIWSWKIFRDADTYGKVLKGGILSLGYMFKQVTAVNMHVLNRLIGTTLNPSKHEYAAPASAGAALGVLLISLYDYITEKEAEIPRARLVLGASPTGELLATYRGIKGLVKVVGNLPVTEQEANNIVGFWRLIGGMPFGASLKPGEVLPDGNMKKVLDNFSFTMDAGYEFFKTVAKGTFEQNDVRALYGFQKEMGQALSKNTLLFGTSNDMLTMVKDAAFITNALYSAISDTDKRATAQLNKTAWDKVKNTGMKLVGASISFGPEHYKDLAYKNWDYDNTRFRMKHWKKRTTYPDKEALSYAMEKYMTIPKNWILRSELRKAEQKVK